MSIVRPCTFPHCNCLIHCDTPLEEAKEELEEMEREMQEHWEEQYPECYKDCDDPNCPYHH